MRRPAHRLVFVDETGTTTKMTRLYGRCRHGRRLKAKAPFGHWKTQTFIAGRRRHGLTAPWVIDRPINRQLFEAYVETQLPPSVERRYRHPRQPGRSQEPEGREGDPRQRRMAPVPACL
jgi:DDE superfamily endonuclease